MVKYLPANAGDTRNAGSVLGSRRSSGEGNGNPLQDSWLENSMTEESGRLQFMGSQRDTAFDFWLPTASDLLIDWGYQPSLANQILMRRSEPKLNADSFNEVFFIMLTIPFTGPKAPLSWDPCFVMAFPQHQWRERGEAQFIWFLPPRGPPLLLPWGNLEKLLRWKMFSWIFFSFFAYHFREFSKIAKGCWLPTRTQ